MLSPGYLTWHTSLDSTPATKHASTPPWRSSGTSSQQSRPGDDWSSRLVRLLDEFPADGVVSLSDMGLPDDWRARLS